MMSRDQAGMCSRRVSSRKAQPLSCHCSSSYHNCSTKQPALFGNISYTHTKAQQGSCHSELSDTVPAMTLRAVLETIAVNNFLRQALPVHFVQGVHQADFLRRAS